MGIFSKTKAIQFPGVEGTVKVSPKKPPVWDSVCATFQINPIRAIFTYGDTIYNPNDVPLNRHLIEHERVHMKQQNYNDKDAALWWGQFLRDDGFRLTQEAQAYARQFLVICETVRDRNQQVKVMRQLSSILAGPLYGGKIDRMTAENMIVSYL